MCPPLLDPPAPPSPSSPSVLSQGTGFGCPASYIKLALVISILHAVMHIFQCCSLKSSHPCLLPLSSDICSLHLCLLCCPVCRIVGTIFPYTEHNDLIYMHLEMMTSFVNIYHLIWASLITQVVKNLPAMQKTTVQFLGWEDPLEKG